MPTTWTKLAVPLQPGAVWDGGDSVWDGGAAVDDPAGALWDAHDTQWTNISAPTAN